MTTDKTEFVVIGIKQQVAKVQLNNITIGQFEITPTSSVRNVEVWFDSTLSMNSHINKTCSLAFYYLYNIRKIRKYLSRESTEKLIHAFVSSRIVYCNGLLFGLPAYQIHKIQRVQNAAARLIYNESKYCRITPLLYNLHWLPVTFRIEFKILLLVYKAFKGFVPGYITELINIKNEGRYRLRSSWNGILLKYVNLKRIRH